MTLKDVSKGRNNNLNLMRLVAAVLVIFSHSWPLSYGADHADILSAFSKGQMTFGNLAVLIFFFFGGFLIMGSAERSKTAGVYYKKRVIRLFPSLAAVVVLSVFILGPLITNLNMQSYFFSIDTYKYLLNAILIPVHDLPGVFTNNVYGQTINGALWTLPVEFVCYVICFTMYQLKLTEYGKFKYTLILFVPAYILLFYVFRNNSLVASVLRIMGMFYAGMLFYVYRDKIKMNFGYASIAFTVFVLSLLFRFTEGTVLLTLSYVFAYLGFGVKKKYHFLDGKPDISYQIYLCAFPLQQLVCMWNGGKMTCGLNFIESLPLVVIIAVLLYEGIDKRIINK